MMNRRYLGIAFAGLLSGLARGATPAELSAPAAEQTPYLVVLGIAQDGGVPQAGTQDHPGWENPAFRRLATSLALVDPASGQRWIIDATPDFREQLHRLDAMAPAEGKPGLAGILLTHAHIGHYTGLMHLGHEAMGSRGVPVYAMPGMREYLSHNGPWSQLVRYENIELRPLEDGAAVQLSERISVTPFLVPHRQEYSEVIGLRIEGPNRSALLVPDIDSWEEWETAGTRIEEVISQVDIAYLDGTFFANGEIPGRDMSGFPHPFITHSMSRFDGLAPEEKAKVRFLHLNHTNPALWPESEAYKSVLERGFRLAEEGERFGL